MQTETKSIYGTIFDLCSCTHIVLIRMENGCSLFYWVLQRGVLWFACSYDFSMTLLYDYLVRVSSCYTLHLD